MTGPQLAAALVTLVGRGWSADDAADTLRGHSIRRSGLSERDSEALEEWATLLREAFVEVDIPRRCDIVNGLLERGTSRAYLTTHDGLRPHLHFAADHDDVVARVKAVTAGGLALFAAQAEGARWGVCRRAGCSAAFVDTSRNGTRAYCSVTCGNYVAVRRHRSSVDRRAEIR